MEKIMSTWPRSLQSGWFVVTPSRRLRSKPLGIKLLGRPIVLARMQDGAVVAMEDRCPHRQYPLSAGRIVSDGLQCGYHGWTFGPDGRCIKVPGQTPDACLPRVGVRLLQIKEFDGFVWLRAASSEEDSTLDFPHFIAQRPPGSRKFMTRMLWQGKALDALENFMDPMHTHMTHPGLVRKGTERRPMTASIEQCVDSICVTYSGQEEQRGLLFRLFESPRSLERVHHDKRNPGSACIEYRYKNGSALFFTLHFTPVEPWKTLIHATLHVEGRWAPSWAVNTFAWPFLWRVAIQDQNAVERQAKNRVQFPDRKDASTELDVVSSYLRSIWLDAELSIPAEKRVFEIKMLA